MCLVRAGRAVKSSGITDFTSSYLQITRARSSTRREISIIGTPEWILSYLVYPRRRAFCVWPARESGFFLCVSQHPLQYVGFHNKATAALETRSIISYRSLRCKFYRLRQFRRVAFSGASKYIVLLNCRVFYKGCSTSWQSVRLNERYGSFCAPIRLDANAVESISPYPENNSPRCKTILCIHVA